MIVGCYTLDLYCRFDGTSDGPQAGTVVHGYNSQPHQFTGPTLSNCRAQARKRGWTFEDDDDATCPMCNRRKAKTK